MGFAPMQSNNSTKVRTVLTVVRPAFTILILRPSSTAQFAKKEKDQRLQLGLA